MKAQKAEEYIKLPYTKEIIENDDGSFFIKVKELPGCMSEADTLNEAYEMIKDAMRSWIIAALEDGIEVPVPETHEKQYSGKVPLRIPKSLHKKLAEDSKREGLSLNSYILVLLSKFNAETELLAVVRSAFCSQKASWSSENSIIASLDSPAGFLKSFQDKLVPSGIESEDPWSLGVRYAVTFSEIERTISKPQKTDTTDWPLLVDPRKRVIIKKKETSNG